MKDRCSPSMANTVTIRWKFVLKLGVLAFFILFIFWLVYPKRYISNPRPRPRLGVQMEQQDVHIPESDMMGNPVLHPPRKTGLVVKDGKFILEGKSLTILSGAMHYFRVLPEYWKDRMLKMRAAGLNTLETYMAWNLHEEIKGSWDFTYMLNVKKYIELAGSLGLYVILRPGPYICSEWELGGLPSWLLHDPNMKLRSTYKPFLDASDVYFRKVMEQVEKLQYQNGGPIIAFQVENEYGSYGEDTKYMTSIKEMMQRHGVIEPLFTSDNGHGLEKGALPNVLMTLNFKKKDTGQEMMEKLRKLRPGNPLFVMEYWTGWFDHWTEPKHNTWVLQEFEEVFKFILQAKCSVNLYMFFGGTNFGFMNGANQWEDRGYSPTITSYDYDAPLNEAGDKTLKYHAVKVGLQKYAPAGAVVANLPQAPVDTEKYKYGIVKSDEMLTWSGLLDIIKPIKLKDVVPMEMLDINNGGGQGYGFIVYRKQIHKNGRLTLPVPICDRAIVLLNGESKAVFDYSFKKAEVDIKGIKGIATLDIIIENLGRVNYGNYYLDLQRKGLQGDVIFDGKKLEDWQIYPLEFKEDYLRKATKLPWRTYSDLRKKSPCIIRGTLEILGRPKDTFLNMQGWEKGVVFINKFNLGRYWSVGPQRTLYVPAPLLRSGANEILIFELHKPDTEVAFVDKPDLGPT